MSVPVSPHIVDISKNNRNNQIKAFKNYFENNNIDAIFVPSSTNTALPLSVSTVEAFNIYVRNFSIAPFNTLPALDIPISISSEGPPIGAELIGPSFSDRKLIYIWKYIHDIIENIQPPPSILSPQNY